MIFSYHFLPISMLEEPKKDGNIQFEITKEYLLDFIKKNEELSDMLYKYRGY